MLVAYTKFTSKGESFVVDDATPLALSWDGLMERS